ncbi:hypothetical protein [Mucilaginibacter antarcticus]|uniref:Uncharacterized protein n=1 Tax=Mucilaginibacter antarcticus TaxID=1855725 RepID=A0ABW5XTQ7_9SPHI
MNVLKTEYFYSATKMLVFVNKNQIPRENILTIAATESTSSVRYTIFYYGDSDVEEEVPSIWD